jgi:succinate dehydrogenase / fumarate reductase flavoprotein subunit
MKITRHGCDVLIVGGGAAGLKAAVALLEGNLKLRLALVVKGKLGRCGTTANAVSDRMAFHATMPYTPPGGRDNWMMHARDIFEIGRRVSDRPQAGILAKKSREVTEYLCSIGVPFARNGEGRISQFLTDGSLYPRACFTGPYTSWDIEKCLKKRLEGFDFDLHEEMMLADILTVSGRKVSGAVCVDRGGNLHLFETPFVVIATGGAGGIYLDNCYPSGMTGDGYGAALMCGAELVNMEFIQFGICSRRLKVACSGSLMRSVPRILDRDGREVLRGIYENPSDIFRVVFRKGASWPVSNEEESRILDIISHREGGLFLDYTSNPSGWNRSNIPGDMMKWYSEKGLKPDDKRPWERLKLINPQIYHHFYKGGIDLSREMVDAFSAAQHFQGGIKIDPWGESSVRGLFACGESAGGQHGANRPGGNALLDTQVFGGRVASRIASRLKRRTGIPAPVDGRGIGEAYSGSFSREELKSILDDVKKSMSLNVSVYREEKSLARLEAEMKARLERIRPSSDLRLYLEVRNSILTSLAVIKGCLGRDESRGPHLMWAGEVLIPSKKRFDNIYLIHRMENGRIVTSVRRIQE